MDVDCKECQFHNEWFISLLNKKIYVNCSIRSTNSNKLLYEDEDGKKLTDCEYFKSKNPVPIIKTFIKKKEFTV